MQSKLVIILAAVFIPLLLLKFALLKFFMAKKAKNKNTPEQPR